MPLHMIKLCVGCDTVEDLLAWRRAEMDNNEPWVMRTRQTPKRAAELVDGGSLYRVYRGLILSRQRILAIATVGEGVNARCEAILDPEVFLTAPTPRRAFQGWRYLIEADAPPDLGLASAGAGPIPSDLARQLRDLGAW